MNFPEHAVHRIVGLKYSGHELKLKTSQGLFSSAHVDQGTLLLLKTLAQRAVLPEQGRVLDAGCGYGPLALAIKKAHPGLEVVARDRLALAAAFTAENARLNKLDVKADVGLLLDEEGPWDRIVSNLPAKAGGPVLADFIPRSLALLAPDGVAAVVIVETLAQEWIGELHAAGASVLYQEAGPGYQVIHYGRGSSPHAVGPVFPGSYERGTLAWSVGKRTFHQPTVFGLPNFDGLDYRLQTTVSLLESIPARGPCLVWEPVQGQLAAWADAVLPSDTELVLAGNDALALRTSQRLARRVRCRSVVAFSLSALVQERFALALVQLHPEPMVPWVSEVHEALLAMLEPGAIVLLNGRSTDLARFLDHHHGLRMVRDQRYRGWRAVILERLAGA